MSQLDAVLVPPPRARTGERHAWVTAGIAALLWAQAIHAGAPQLSAGFLTPGIATALGCATQLVCVSIEAMCARLMWLVFGHAPSYPALTARILTASACEAFAAGVLVGAPALPVPLALVLCGPRVAPGYYAHSGAESAFAAFGALTVLRLVVSAAEQARLARGSFARGMLVVVALYLVTRLVLLWGFDLLQGHSFESAVGILSWPVTPSLA